MKRLTRPAVKVDETAAQYMAATGSIPVDLRSMNDRLLDLVINGPTLNGVNKDVLRQLIRQLYAALMPYEDTGLEPEDIKELCTDEVAEVARTFRRMIQSGEIAHLQELLNAEQEGRLVVLPCKVGDTVYAVKFATHEETEDGDLMPIAGGGKWVIWTVRVGIINYCDRRTKNTHGYVVGSTQNGSGATFDFDDFGKTVFLTSEEAERALEGGADNA